MQALLSGGAILFAVYLANWQMRKQLEAAREIQAREHKKADSSRAKALLDGAFSMNAWIQVIRNGIADGNGRSVWIILSSIEGRVDRYSSIPAWEFPKGDFYEPAMLAVDTCRCAIWVFKDWYSKSADDKEAGRAQAVKDVDEYLSYSNKQYEKLTAASQEYLA